MSSFPGPHPLPRNLSAVVLPTVARDSLWFRHYKPEFDPLYFGRTGECRFDAPPPERAFGVMYLAADEHGAFVETFGHGHVHRTRLLTFAAVAAKRLAEVRFDAPLRLVDLTDAGLVRIGADLRLCAGEYEVAQHWSGALHAHPEAPDGLLYRSRHDPSRLCAAVYDRVATRAHAQDAGTLADPDRAHLLAELLRTYGFGLY